MAKVSRRKFIVRSLIGGAGVIVGATYLARNPLRRKLYDLLDDPSMLAYSGDTSQPFMWFEVTKANQVILHSPKVEMGQGTFTGLVQIACDELELDINQMKIVHATSASGNIDGLSTGGSTSIAGLWQPLRELSATLREMLKAEGAKKMGVAVNQVRASAGTIIGPSGSLTYGEVVEGVSEWEVPEAPPLKDLKDYKYIGKPVSRVDLVDKVMGTPMFGMDAQMPDMLYGSVVRPSKIGAKFKGADVSKAASMPGVVKVVQEDDFVGVVATSFTEAENAKKAIVAEWETDREWNTHDIEEMLLVGKGEAMVIQKEGDAEGELVDENGGQVLTSEFKSPIGAHAQIEPNGAVAYAEKDRATVMISTQVVGITRSEVAKRLGLEDEQVNIIPTYLGGGFGRRLHTPNAIQAAVLSKAVGKPVKCFFSRQEEFQNDTFRPPTHHVMKGKLDENGKIVAIEHQFSSGDVMFGSALLPPVVGTILGADGGAIRGGSFHYRNIPSFRAVAWRVQLPFSTSWWRSLGLLANTFAIESFMDELAELAGKDPIAFRLDHINDDEAGMRLKKVIETAKTKLGYQNMATNGRAMGFACSTDAGTPCAQVAEVSVVDGAVRIDKVTCVMDPGFAVNPDQVKAQCEGSIIMGISASLFERMYVEKSELKPVIYGPYRMALMRDAPREIEVEIINGTGVPGAVGEPPLGPIAAAIANAVYRITGKRVRELPMSVG
jgi:isoquinoline 1-oxidoreductase subunit beta